MKKIALLFLTLLTLWSCGDELEFNSPGFQGNKNYSPWRATYYNAVMASDGSLTITAGNNSEEMRFIVPGVSFDTINLTVTSFSKAEFRDFENIEYSTSNAPDPSVSLYPEIGKLLFIESPAGTVSGKFTFIAYTDDGLQSVGFSGFNECIFYRIPISGGGNTGNTLSCQQATTNLATATTNFSEVMPGDAQYSARCNAYKTALQDAMTACGDTTGAFQAIIDSLGDCN